jgi:asparagine synthase (glutamine-hydrolysing)
MGTAHMQSYEFAVRQLVQERAFDGWFNGIGGDSVFCWLRSALPVADCVLSLRSPLAIVRSIRDVAILADVSASAVLRQTLRFLLQGRRPVRPRGVEQLLTQEARRRSARLRLPPWFAAPKGILPGRANHVEMIARVHNMIEGLDRWTAPPTVIPLLSQPIVELCLRISSWNWIAGGRNRAVARDAYAHALPARILERRSKGGPDRMSIAVCLSNLPLLREMLLDGHLAKSGLLERDLLERLLTEQSFLKSARHVDILQLADAESWYAHWLSLGETRSIAPPLGALRRR